MRAPPGFFAAAALAALAAACTPYLPPEPGPTRGAAGAGTPAGARWYGTLEPFASEAVYFVVTDRFVDGDPSNNQEGQGAGPWHTFDRPVTTPGGLAGNIGYLGGDFRGVLDNAAYVADMGFTAIWITPIVDNPDEAFSGGQKLGEGIFADQGKTGYHGYWGVNFYEEDEHLVSDGLRFRDLTRRLADEHGLDVVLDVVCNHGSPSFSMPVEQPKFGELYDASGRLVADHQNLRPEALNPAEPLHAFFHREPDIAQLSNLDDTNPDVLDYCAGAYLQWLGQGAAALRIDTIKHMPHAFWKGFADRIRAGYPGLFMFAEHWTYDQAAIAEHQRPENGAISVLDFPGQQAMARVFGKEDAPYDELADYLHLDDGAYVNPYELMTFYDNHDMPRMDADAAGFINANNWLFTSRGIPVVYYGSEVGFRAGRPEHGGNRDYFGQARVDAAVDHPVRTALKRIARVRAGSPALQRGLQANISLDGDAAAFYRVYEDAAIQQTALVVLNKGDDPLALTIDRWLASGQWRDAISGETMVVDPDTRSLAVRVAGNGARVLLLDAPNDSATLAAELRRLQAAIGESG